MSAWSLPTSLTVGGVGYSIETDFRKILNILAMLGDPELEEDEKAVVFIMLFYPDYQLIPRELYQEAANQAVEFLDMGLGRQDSRRPSTMDWEQDAPVIIPAVNRVLGREVRAMEYLHWWTFLGAYMEIGESLFSSVLNIRQKKARGKKLEKYEEEFYRENRNLIDLKKTPGGPDPGLERLKRQLGFV